jgi:hypothetical protein
MGFPKGRFPKGLFGCRNFSLEMNWTENSKSKMKRK